MPPPSPGHPSLLDRRAAEKGGHSLFQSCPIWDFCSGRPRNVTVISPPGLRNRARAGAMGSCPHRSWEGWGAGGRVPRASCARQVPVRDALGTRPPAPQPSCDPEPPIPTMLYPHHRNSQTGGHPFPYRSVHVPPQFWGCREPISGLKRRLSGEGSNDGPRGGGKQPELEFPGVCTSPAQALYKGGGGGCAATRPPASPG